MKIIFGIIFVFIAQSVFGQVQSLQIDKNGNVLNSSGATFGTGIPLRVTDAASIGTDVTNKDYVDDAISGLTTGVSSFNTRTGAVTSQSGDYTEAQISFSDITTNNSSSSNHGYFPKLTGDPTLFFNGEGAQVAIPGSGSVVSQLISGGGVAWTGSGFDFIISAATYLINGVQYSSSETPVTLDPSDMTNDRIDTFYVDASGLSGVLTGTPGDPAVEPQVDPATQLRLIPIRVEANATEPTVAVENIYLENTEWTTSTNSSGTITLASTNNPYAGTKDIEGTSVATGNYFTAVKPSGTINPTTDFDSLVLYVRSKAAWPKQKSETLFWLSGTTVIGNSVAIKDGTFGFNSSNTSSYQLIVIPTSSFGVGSVLTVDRLRVATSGGGGNIGWYIDNIMLQRGGGGGGGSGGTVTSFTAGNASPLFTTSVSDPTTTPNLTFSLLYTPEDVANKSTSTSLGTSDTLYPSQKAVKTYVDNAVGTPITPAALTKTDDTNVTLTLGGTPTTALLQATSLTLGWTGQLSLARGGTAASLTDPNADVLWGWDDTDNAIKFITIGSGLTYDHPTHTIAASAQAQTHAVTFVVDGSGAVLSTGTKNAVKIPFGGTLVGWLLNGSPSGSVTVDIFRSADGAGLPVTSIVGAGTKPALSTQTENSSTSFTSWTSTTLTAKDNLAISLSGITASTYVALTLYFQ